MFRNIVKTTIFLFLLIFFFQIPGNAQRPPEHYDVRALGMGNAYTANAYGPTALYYNPAMLGKTGFHLEILGVRATLNNRLREVIKFVRDNKDNFQNFSTLTPTQANQFLKNMEPLDDRYYGFHLTPAMGITIGHVGIGTYVDGNPNVKLDKGIYIPRIFGKGYVDWVTTVGYGRKINVPALRNFYAGAAVKYIQRHTAPEVEVNATDAAQFNQLAQTMLDSLQSPVSGFAVDLGSVFSPAPNLDVGLALQNIGSINGDSFTPMLNVGAAYNFKAVSMLPLIKNLTVTGDYRDFFNSAGVSFFNHLHLGAEFGFLNLALRAGINQGYFTAGAGINLAILHLDYAYFGQELGEAPGWHPDLNHMLQLRVGF